MDRRTVTWSQCSERENLSLVQLQGSFSSTKVRITLTIILDIWIDESRDGSKKKKKKIGNTNNFLRYKVLTSIFVNLTI